MNAQEHRYSESPDLPVNVSAAGQALATAVVLVGLSSLSGSLVPLVAAGGVTAYVLLVLVRLPQLIARMVVGAGFRWVKPAVIIAGIVAVSTVAADAGNPVIMAAGSLAFAGALVAILGYASWAGIVAGRALFGVLISGTTHLRTEFAVLTAYTFGPDPE